MRSLKYSILPGFLLACAFGISSCRKDKSPTLPPATQTGANTFGFTINDEVWVPFSECGFGSDPCGKFLVNVYPPYVDWVFSQKHKGRISQIFFRVKDVGPYSITSTGNKLDSIKGGYSPGTINGIRRVYYGPLPGSKFVITRYDSIAQIISGEFEFIFKEDVSNFDTIHIKNGRFDFKFSTCKCD